MSQSRESMGAGLPPPQTPEVKYSPRGVSRQPWEWGVSLLVPVLQMIKLRSPEENAAKPSCQLRHYIVVPATPTTLPVCPPHFLNSNASCVSQCPLHQPQALFLVFKALPRYHPHAPPHSFSGLFFVIPLPSKQTMASAPEVGTHYTFILFLRLLHMHIPLHGALSLFLLPGDSYSSIDPQLRRCLFWFKHRAPSVRWRSYGRKEK